MARVTAARMVKPVAPAPKDWLYSRDEPAVSRLDDPFQLLKRVHEELQILDSIDAAAGAALRRELFAKPIDSLSAADLARVQERLVGPPAPGGLRPSYIERDYGAYLDAIPHGRTLLGDIEDLARSSGFADFARKSERVFVEHLGFGMGRVDETDRLNRSEIARVEKIGSFHEFDVVCVELTRPNWYADFYSVVFRLHPYALVLSLEPRARALRFVYRRNPSARPEYRSLTGPHTDWEPNDNLLVWAWRLHQLRPRIGESLQTLQSRVSDALSRSPEEIGSDWPSIRFPGDQSPPGVPWVSAARHAFESFLQLDTPQPQRRRWGLDSVLRDRFPVELPYADASVEYVGYDVAAALPAGIDGLEVRDSEREINLHLALCQGEKREAIDILCCLPEPDDEGRFLFDGICQRFSAVVSAGGRLTSFMTDAALTDDESDDDADEEADETDEGDDAESAADEPATDSNAPEAAGRSAPRGFRGLSPRAFLEYAVSRRFAGAAHALRKTYCKPDVPLREHVHVILMRAGRRSDRLPLAARGVMRSFLQPDRGASTLLAEDWRIASIPPSWCCLDRSAGLPVGSFIPVAGARMHPTGSLAVPILEGTSARLVLSHKAAHAVHARIVGPATAETRGWWISYDLAKFAPLPVGQLEHTEDAVHARAIQARVLLLNRPERRARVLHSLTLPRRRPQALSVRVPARRGGPPTLLVQVGSIVAAGDVWLRLAPKTWSMTHWEPAGIERLADEIAERAQVPGEPFVGDPRVVLRVPAGVAGTVTHTSVARVQGSLGVDAGWVARVMIEPAAEAYGTIIMADGAAYSIVSALPHDDVPFNGDGEIVEVVLEGPNITADGGETLFDPTTEEFVRGAVVSTILHIAPAPISMFTPPERHGQVRIFDGEGIPGHALSPAFTERERLRWLILDSAAARFAFELDSVLPVPTWIVPFRDAALAAGVSLDHALAVVAASASVSGDFFDPTVTRMHKPLPDRPEGAVRALARPVLHPWNKAAAGALLGVTVDELDLLVCRHGVTSVIEALGIAAKEAPEEAALQRLELVGSRERQQALGEGLLALRQLSGIPDLGTLVLTALPVPSVRMLPFGVPAGSSRPLHTPLFARYRQIDLASELCRDLEHAVDEVRVAAEVELQRAVDALFGSLGDRTSRGKTLAGWLTRAWPLTRGQELRTSCDDLTWGTGADGRPVPAVLDEDGAFVCPPARAEVRAPADPGWWLERSARAWLLEQRSAWFLGLFASLDTEDGPRPGAPIDVSLGARGAWAAREWVRRLELPESCPSRLVRLLTRNLPLRLASDGVAARAALEPALLLALPGLDVGAQQLRGLLAEIFAGFWSLTPDIEAPSGWAWFPADAAPAHGSRYLPPHDHRAWLLWPWTTWASSPPKLVVALAAGRRLPPLLRVVCGYPDGLQLLAPTTMDLPSSPGTVEAPSDALLQPQALEPLVLTLEPLEMIATIVSPTDEDIVVAKIGLRAWLEQTRKEVSP